MVIEFDFNKDKERKINSFRGGGFMDLFTSMLPVLKSAGEAVVPIAQTAYTIKKTIDLNKNKVAESKPITLKNTPPTDIFARIKENIEKKKSGGGFVKVNV